MEKTRKGFIQYLSASITPRRLALLECVLKQRTRQLTVVLEDIFQPHNASAVLRSCECFGIQDVHIIENKNKYRVNPQVVMGSAKWLTLHHYNGSSDNTRFALNHIKSLGYKLVATIPNEKAVSLNNFIIPPQQKIALLFGCELHGLSATAFEMADEMLTIPMHGFTESLNISVSAALCLQVLSSQLRLQPSENWQLNPNEIEVLTLEWLKSNVKNPEMYEKRYYNGTTP